MIMKIVCRDKISIMKKWINRKVAGDRTVGDALGARIQQVLYKIGDMCYFMNEQIFIQ